MENLETKNITTLNYDIQTQLNQGSIILQKRRTKFFKIGHKFLLLRT